MNVEINASILISIIGAGVSLTAVMVSIVALVATNKVAATQLFLSLRNSHDEIHSKMDSRYHDDNWNPLEEKDACKTIEKIWLHTFSEWFATVKLNKGNFKSLWTDYYKPAIAGGLRNKPLRIVLCNMLDGKPGSSFSGFRDEFGATIEELYRDTYKKELKEDI